MTLEINKPKINLREEVNQLKKPTGVAGEAMLRAETPQEQQALIGLGRKNIMINGANLVNQRGTVTGINSATLNYGGPDRRNLYVNHPGESVFMIQQGNSGLSEFPKSCRIDCSTAGATLTGGEEIKTEIPLEGYDVQQIGYGTPQAKFLTISFWVKSNQAANFVLWMYRPDGARHSSKVYTINNPNTWEYKTLTFNPDVSDPVAVDETPGLYVSFILNSGTNYTSGTSPDGTWQDITSPNRYAGLTADIGSSTNDYFEFTGLQVETGQVATPFEHRPFGEELALCQRYFQQRITGGAALGAGIWYTNTQVLGYYKFDVTMRTSPTVTVSSDISITAYGRGANKQSTDTSIMDNIQVDSARLNLVMDDAGVQGDGTHIQISQGTISLDAEL